MAVSGYNPEMSISMSKTIKEERLRWVLPIVNKEIKIVDAAKICPYGKRSLERWVASYKKAGEAALEPKSTSPKTNPKETPIGIKERIISKRKQTKLCAQKIHWLLKKEGLHVPVRTIGKILKQENLVRKYRIRKIKYIYVRAERKPGELIEIDVKYVPGRLENKRYYQYTAIDTASRWRYLKIYEEQSNYHSILFLEEVMQKFPYRIQAVKTDNGFVFTNRYTGTYKREDLSPRKLHGFDRFCAKHDIIHYLIDPGKPAQNGKVERSHRTDQEMFYEKNNFRGLRDLKMKIRIWNNKYNNLMHCGLNGKTPNEFLIEYQLTNPPNVLA
jgi:transposase InsO family protein